jgi:hypothetical protein
MSAPIFDNEGPVPYPLTITVTPFRLQPNGERGSLKLGRAAGSGGDTAGVASKQL